MAIAGEPISQLPAAASLAPADLIVVVQGGITKRSTVGSARAGAGSFQLLTTSGPVLAGFNYGLRSGAAAITASLPPATSGAEIVVYDADNKCSVNNGTLVPNGADTILYYGASATSLIMNLNGAGILLIGETGAWRALPL